MNKIFNRIIDIEEELNSLIEDIGLALEPCKYNKEEIEHYLIHASHCVSKVYKLNKSNFEDYAPATKQAVEQTSDD